MTTDREQELDATMQELRGARYIHEPNEKDVPVGACCFLDRARVCGPDCAAYLGEGPLPVQRCQLLNAAEAIPALLTALSSRGAP